MVVHWISFRWPDPKLYFPKSIGFIHLSLNRKELEGTKSVKIGHFWHGTIKIPTLVHEILDKMPIQVY